LFRATPIARRGWSYYHATRAELLRRLGRRQDAIDAYQRAIVLEDDEAQRAFLQHTLAELQTDARSR
jgi:RNA polymerase sigma-70 factor (ECF subfamily)